MRRIQHQPFRMKETIATRLIGLSGLCCALLVSYLWLSIGGPEQSGLNFLSSSIRKTELGAVVLLAPQRNAVTWWSDTQRFCFLMRAVRSVDQHLNQHYGPYPIYLLVAKDHRLDPLHKDGPYTAQDRALIRSWAPHSTIIFQEINLYSEDALEPGTTVDQIAKWRLGQDGGTEGRDLGYQSMCRLWSGRLQTMKFLRPYKYYMRMDDDSLLITSPPFDPFKRMEDKGLEYVYRRLSMEQWGVSKLKEIIKRHIPITTETPFIREGEYSGAEPYNNFHISKVDFWSSPQWQAFWKDLNQENAFFKYRLGDANVHAAAIMMLQQRQYKMWPIFPYVHNTNDMKTGWGKKEWRLECEAAEQQMKISHNQSSSP